MFMRKIYLIIGLIFTYQGLDAFPQPIARNKCGICRAWGNNLPVAWPHEYAETCAHRSCFEVIRLEWQSMQDIFNTQWPYASIHDQNERHRLAIRTVYKIIAPQSSLRDYVE